MSSSYTLYPHISLPEKNLQQLLTVWFLGIWTLLIPQDYSKNNKIIKQYINQCIQILNCFVPKSAETNTIIFAQKSDCLRFLLTLQNQLQNTTFTEKDIVTTYQRLAFSDSIKIQYVKKTNEQKFTPSAFPSCFVKEDKYVYIESFDAFDDKDMIVGTSSSSVFGPLLWIQLFLFTLYDDLVSEFQKDLFVQNVFSLLFCPICKNHAESFWQKHKKEQRLSTFGKVLKLHNEISRENKKKAKTKETIEHLLSLLLHSSTLTLQIDYSYNALFQWMNKKIQDAINPRRKRVTFP